MPATPHAAALFPWPGKAGELLSLPLAGPVDGHDPKPPGQSRRLRTRLARGWHGPNFGKTQYAAKPECGGVPHFLRCHLSVIRLLDFAQKLGLVEEVSDEGGFWDMPDVPSLARAVGGSSAQVADAVGRWRNLLGDAGEAAISGRADSEPRGEHCSGAIPEDLRLTRTRRRRQGRATSRGWLPPGVEVQ